MAMSQWWTFSDGLIDTEKDQGGAYELGDSSKAVIYIGSSGVVKSRLKAHKRGDSGSCTKNASYYRVDYRSDYAEEERRLIGAYETAHGRLPRCNDVRP